MSTIHHDTWQLWQDIAQRDAMQLENPAPYSGTLAMRLRSDQTPRGYATRLPLLFAHHRVSYGDRDGLLAALIVAHVPGFRRSRTGKKREKGKRIKNVQSTDRGLVGEADRWKQAQQQKISGRVSDRQFARHRAKLEKKRPTEKDVDRWATKLSRARRTVTER